MLSYLDWHTILRINQESLALECDHLSSGSRCLKDVIEGGLLIICL